MSMNRSLSDTVLDATLARMAARVSDTGLREEILDAVARTPQVRRRSLRLPTWPALTRRSDVLWAAILVALLLGMLLATVLLVGAGREDRLVVVAPSPTSPQATSSPASPPPTPRSARPWDPATPGATIAALMSMWPTGDVSGAENLYAPDRALRLIGDSSAFDHGAQHFEVIPGGRGYIYWEVAGDPVSGGAFWVLPSVAGIWDPGRDVMAVFRFPAEDRIAAEWIITAGATPTAPHEERKGTAAPADAETTSLLDRCADRGAAPDVAAACYAPDAGFWISSDEPGTDWTEAYVGADAIRRWIAGPSAYDGITRTGDPIALGSLVTYPFTGAVPRCAVGVDVFELTADRTRIAGHWAFCGPNLLPAGLIGSWATPGIHPATLTLHACAAGEECGTFGRWDGSEQCAYPLQYRGVTGDRVRFFTSGVSSFGCGWSPWWQSILDVRPATDGTLEVVLSDHPDLGTHTGLRRVEGSGP